jgi:hypothetical protein
MIGNTRHVQNFGNETLRRTKYLLGDKNKIGPRKTGCEDGGGKS